MLKLILTGFLLAALASSTPQETSPLNTINFEIKNAGFPVKGSLSGIHSKIVFDPTSPESGSIEVSAEPATILAGNSIREKHLKRSDYFDVQHFPLVSMKSLSLKGLGGGSFNGTFKLSIKSISKIRVIPFHLEKVQDKKVLVSDFEINRLDYAVGEKSIILSDIVRVHVQLAF